MNREQQPILYMLTGIPGCGKSSWAEAMKKQGVHVHSSDALRRELLHDENCQNNAQMIFEELGKRIIIDLKKGYSVIYDATNLSRKRRQSFLEKIQSIDCRKINILFLTPPEVCEKRDQRRQRTVGKNVIDRLLRSFECPYWYEGWDEIIPLVSHADWQLPMDAMTDFAQDNSHHTLTLGSHMDKAYQYCVDNQLSEEIQIAARYHDCGKYFTKKFCDFKGEPTEQAHYYGHENYGTYLFLLDAYQGGGDWKYGSLERTLYIANLINWHMRPFNVWDHSRKAMEKDRKLLGERMMNDILSLHEADLQAH